MRTSVHAIKIRRAKVRGRETEQLLNAERAEVGGGGSEVRSGA
jgi:hypothetical protein